MTPGPASFTDSALPRKSPVPMAPPTAIMESWRGVRLRCSHASRSRIAEELGGFAAREASVGVIARHRSRRITERPMDWRGPRSRLNLRTAQKVQLRVAPLLYFCLLLAKPPLPYNHISGESKESSPRRQ